METRIRRENQHEKGETEMRTDAGWYKKPARVRKERVVESAGCTDIESGIFRELSEYFVMKGMRKPCSDGHCVWKSSLLFSMVRKIRTFFGNVCHWTFINRYVGNWDGLAGVQAYWLGVFPGLHTFWGFTWISWAVPVAGFPTRGGNFPTLPRPGFPHQWSWFRKEKSGKQRLEGIILACPVYSIYQFLAELNWHASASWFVRRQSGTEEQTHIRELMPL